MRSKADFLGFTFRCPMRKTRFGCLIEDGVFVLQASVHWTTHLSIYTATNDSLPLFSGHLSVHLLSDESIYSTNSTISTNTTNTTNPAGRTNHASRTNHANTTNSTSWTNPTNQSCFSSSTHSNNFNE